MRRHPGLGHPASSRPEQKRPVRTGGCDRMRILVVDRDDDRRDLACVSVSVLGHRAEEAWNLRDALIALGTGAFDVIIVDEDVPGFDPLEVTDLLLAGTRPTRRRPAVIVVAAELDPYQRTALFRAGVAEVVPRPLALAPLHGLLTRIRRAASI